MHKKKILFIVAILTIIIWSIYNFNYKEYQSSSGKHVIKTNKGERVLIDEQYNLPFSIDADGWELSIKYKDDFNTEITSFYYELYKSGDTTKTLAFYTDENGNIIDVVRYYKKYIADNNKLIVNYRKEGFPEIDTFYYYKELENGEKIFEVGEYNYRWTYGKLHPSEQSYYYQHIDSLRWVRGNGLPKLPIISTDK
jgi:hypothetical protein